MKKMYLDSLIIIPILILIFLCCLFSSNLIKFKYSNNGLLIINEIMASNKSTLLLNDVSYDYIELYNGYDYDVDLKGYYLSDDDFNNRIWQFNESVVIKSKDYLIVYASGLDEIKDDCVHTNFKLNKNGGTVTLSSAGNKVLSKIRYDKTLSDTSYGFNGNEYVYYYTGTPGTSNSGSYQVEPIYKDDSKYKLRINEYTNNNVSLHPDNDGNYYSMIELYNYSDSLLNLDNFCLSNKLSECTYKFKDISIDSDSYLVVYLSGLSKVSNNEIHTNFKLDKDDKYLVLKDNKQNIIDTVTLDKLLVNMVAYYNDNNELLYSYGDSFGRYNDNVGTSEINYADNIDIVINEATKDRIELYNSSNHDINLSGYKIKGNGSYLMTFPDIDFKANSYLVLYESDEYSYENGKIYVGFRINSSGESLSLYDNYNNLISELQTGKLSNEMSYGYYNDSLVIYRNNSIGSVNDSSYYLGYSNKPIFSSSDLYVEKGSKVYLKVNDGGSIYYTLDGSFPDQNSLKYVDGITIGSNVTIKAVNYLDGYIESDIVSRTYLVENKHDLPVVSLSMTEDNFNYMLANYKSNSKSKVSVTYYESDGSFGFDFVGDTRFSGMDSREKAQKSFAVYLNSDYGKSSIFYPLFVDSSAKNYQSFTLRNSGEDPRHIKIMDTVLTYMLKGEMDIDIQGYRAAVLYVNGKYYGIYNIRERLNGDYIETNYDISKDDLTLIKYKEAKFGSYDDYSSIYSYIMNHDCSNIAVYNYIKTQIDVQELANYMIVESFYGNTDLGNIRYWKQSNGKWRWMLYDLDWSLWNQTANFTYPVVNSGGKPAATYLFSVIQITRKLYKNEEFKDLYLSSFAKYLTTTFKPERVNAIIDSQASDIQNEIPNQISRWGDIVSVNAWKNSISNFKNSYLKRYNYVYNNFKTAFSLSDAEYNKYLGV